MIYLIDANIPLKKNINFYWSFNKSIALNKFHRIKFYGTLIISIFLTNFMSLIKYF